MRTAGPLKLQAERALSRLWLATHGEYITGERLWRALGFRTRRSFESAARENRVPVELHQQTDRRGRYAWTKDVVQAIWKELEQRRTGGGAP